MTLQRFEQLDKVPNNEILAVKYDLFSMQLTRKELHRTSQDERCGEMLTRFE